MAAAKPKTRRVLISFEAVVGEAATDEDVEEAITTLVDQELPDRYCAVSFYDTVAFTVRKAD